MVVEQKSKISIHIFNPCCFYASTFIAFLLLIHRSYYATAKKILVLHLPSSSSSTATKTFEFSFVLVLVYYTIDSRTSLSSLLKGIREVNTHRKKEDRKREFSSCWQAKFTYELRKFRCFFVTFHAFDDDMGRKPHGRISHWAQNILNARITSECEDGKNSFPDRDS